MISFLDEKIDDFDAIPVDSFWNTGDEKEQLIHRIHSYPAKFPAFITSKALDFAHKNNINVSYIADIFCGCGTVAYESKRNHIPFWGCDINPVATLIAKTKSNSYNNKLLLSYLDIIINEYNKIIGQTFKIEKNERLAYWYSNKQYNDLTALKMAIESVIPIQSKYRLFFLCAFSNILKPTSFWLTKSIKPQFDPKKIPADVITEFTNHCKFMINANAQSRLDKTKSHIVTGNFLSKKIKPPTVDMIITSPPYVTSYEYADLHQLSSLWLGFTKDYKEFRKGSIGSLYHIYDFDKEYERLNKTASIIVKELLNKQKSKARSVAKYFLDMQDVVSKSFNMLTNGGLALFVIGNTEYKNVRIDNARHLAESLHHSGFKQILITKRKVQQKILTPYRDNKGKFSSNCEGSRKVYNEEFLVLGIK